MKLNIAYDFLPKLPTAQTAMVMSHFGITFETGQHVIAQDFELPVRTDDVVAITGCSGAGKSSLLRAVARQLHGVLDLDLLELSNKSLIDSLPLPFPEAMQLLSLCGLSEAQLLLRTPTELSDGQRYRFRLALAFASKPRWILADEFTATLDRSLARVIARNLRKLASRTGVGLLLATTHDDLTQELEPDLFVRCELGTTPRWSRACAKKKDPACSMSSTSPPPLARTGRTLLGGITGGVRSA